VWLSPNGGIVVFAPLLVIPVIALAIAGWKTKTWVQRFVSAAPLGLLFLLCIGFGRWFSPFGWWTWGPRLCLPWLAPLLVLALDNDGARLERWAAKLLWPWPVALGLTAVVIVLALPHVTMLPDSDAFYGFFVKNLDCPNAPHLDVRAGVGPFYDCLDSIIFARKDFALARAYADLGKSDVRVPLMLYAALLAGLCFWLRRETKDVA
jgi:hypothetical protein